MFNVYQILFYIKNIYYKSLLSRFTVGWIIILVRLLGANILLNIIERVYVCLRELEISFEKGEMLLWLLQ